MKKLMFATALAASVAAFADAPTAINAVGFSGYNLGETFGNGKGETNEEGTGNFFYFDSTNVVNSSVVTNDSPSAKRTAFFAGGENTDAGQYLALDTEGGTFWRGLNNTVSEGEENPTYSLGAAQPVASTGTYLDTLVQFTVTEDEAPTTSASDKLAIWLGVSTDAQGEVTGTNLMVRAGYLDDNGSDSFVTAKDFILSTAEPIEAGRWYRLTIKTIGDVTGCVAKNPNEYQSGYMGFEIYLDGVQLAAEEATISTAYMDVATGVATGAEQYAWLNQTTDADFIAYLQSKKVFPSLQDKQAAYAIQGVGFQGTGAVDEIVWTEDDLFPAGGPTVVDYTFTLTFDANVTGAEVTTNGVAAVLDGEGKVQIVAGTTVAIAQPTFATGYQLSTVTTNGTAVVDPQFPFSFTMDAAMTVAITSELIPVTYPSYIDTTDATIKGKYDAWKQAVGFDDSSTSTHLNQFLLNVDEETTVGDAALTITEIKENATAGWDITIGCTVTGAKLMGAEGSTIVCNGYLAVSYTDDLAGTWTTENIPVTAVDTEAGTVTVTVNKSGAKFMKVTLTAAPAQAAGE